MSDEQAKEKNPTAFISYSHDTPEHKKWVGELASKLMANGVDVILDQWEIGPGDDVPKFMERSVAKADCVLMICSEAYVRKADDGKGGAGYEAMIVTGELVKDLGTSKFVPIIRQAKGGNQVPRSVSTRYYVNLSEDANFDEQFKDLLHKIHKVPKVKKPTLGKSPFPANVVDTEEVPSAAVAAPVKTGAAGTGQTYYTRAAKIISTGDLLSWRNLLKEARRISGEGLVAWRQKYEKQPPQNAADLPAMVSEAFGAVSPLVAAALAGVESSSDKFHRQLSIVDDLLSPPNWSGGGYSVIVDLPDALVFVYQALHGALCMQTDQMDLALELVRSKYRRIDRSKPATMLHETEWMGWAKSINENCTVNWQFLVDLPDSHPWVAVIFGTKEDYLAALSAYYAMLSMAEMADTLAGGHPEIVDGRELHFSVPLCGFTISSELVARAYRYLTSNPDQLKKVWEGVGVSTATMAKHWAGWTKSCHNWLTQVYRRHRHIDYYVQDIFELPGLKSGSSTTKTV